MVLDNKLLEDVFNNFLEGPKIFKNRDAIRPDYIPQYLPHREEQIIRIGHILAPVLRGFRGSNLFIYGKTGTGKTAVVKHVLEHLLHKSREVNSPISISYVNCRISGTNYRILADLGADLGIKIPFTGLATNEVYSRFKTSLDLQKILMIVVLDEIDTLVKDHGDSILYELTRINELLKHSRLSIVGISNDIMFKEFLDPRVLSSLSEEEVVFRPYMAPEIRDILLDRTKITFYDDVLSEGALNICSALAASEHGDARRALSLLRVAGELVEREGSAKILEVHIRQAQKKIEHDRVTMILRTLTPHSRLVLCGMFLIKKAKITTSITGDVYEVYTELCGEIGFEPLTQRRVSSLISELDIMGVFNARLVSLGRYGRTKKIRLSLTNSTIIAAYSEDPWLKNLLKFKPKCLLSKMMNKNAAKTR
jgi:cell division control protein 6